MDREGNTQPKPPAHSVLIYYLYKVDLFSKDVILIPINHDNSHWTAAAINFRTKRIESYDSMGMPRTTIQKVPAVLPSLCIAGLD